MRIHCEKGTWTVSLWPEFTGIGDFGTVRCSGCPFFYSWGPFWGQFSSIRWAQRWKAHLKAGSPGSSHHRRSCRRTGIVCLWEYWKNGLCGFYWEFWSARQFLPESCFTREQSIWHLHPQSLSVCWRCMREFMGSCAMDHGRGAGGWKRENQVMDDGIFYGAWNYIWDIHKSKFFSADLPTVLERHIWKSWIWIRTSTEETISDERRWRRGTVVRTMGAEKWNFPRKYAAFSPFFYKKILRILTRYCHCGYIQFHI